VRTSGGTWVCPDFPGQLSDPEKISIGILFGFVVFFGATYLIATEYVASSKSKGEVLIFRKGHVPRKDKVSDDEEAASTSTKAVGRSNELIKVNSLAAIRRQVSTVHWENIVYDIKVHLLLKVIYFLLMRTT
jgi:ATP-binding cassette, subfamily G (WHITE), member 2, PDR